MSDIKSEAAAWAIRVDAGPLDEARRLELEAWLAGDPRRRGAFLRAQAGLRLLDQSRVVSKVVPAPTARTTRRARGFAGVSPRAGWALAAMAAGLGAVVLMPPAFGGFRTEVGEQRRVALRDGSVAMINTDSSVGVRLAKHQRRITLRRGEAWFQVAKDHARPFVVDAGPVHVRATGTAFSVRREGDDARVVVTEGTVLAWRDGALVPPLAISAGHEAFLAGNAPQPPEAKPSRTEDVLAWRRGEIVLDGGTIASAVEEFNRYNTRKIVLRDPAVGRRTIVGYFLIDQPKQFASAAARMTGNKITEGDDRIVIEHSQ